VICLVDLSGIFWRNYFGCRSDVDAYQITLEQIEGYCHAYEQTAVCCDCGPLLRAAWYPEYKANRDEKPNDAIDSLRAIEQQVQSWKTPLLKIRGYEADDLIAGLVEQAWLDEVRIVSSDKDLYQLITDSVRLITTRGEVGEAECVAKFGVRPTQMRDFLALAGDASDNVKGCPGIGPGRARDLLVRFGTLDGVMSATDEELREVQGMGDKTIGSLRAWPWCVGRDPATAVQLVTLLRDAPVNLEELWNVAA
jgi:5'-3' exonuclease